MVQPLRVHYFQHIQDEGLGSPAAWLLRHDAKITTTPFYRLNKGDNLGEGSLGVDVLLPELVEVDLLIIMGGEMSVNDVDKYPWLIAEKQWIRQFIDLGKPVVGLCLGGQLIANSLGAPVTKNKIKEIGWWEIRATPVLDKTDAVFAFPARLTALCWHEDTFAIPEGAIRLAENDACANQAFQYGARVLGFQFHPESTQKNLQLFLVDSGYQKLGASPESHRYIQTPVQMAHASPEQFEAANLMLERALDFVVRKID